MVAISSNKHDLQVRFIAPTMCLNLSHDLPLKLHKLEFILFSTAISLPRQRNGQKYNYKYRYIFENEIILIMQGRKMKNALEAVIVNT